MYRPLNLAPANCHADLATTTTTRPATSFAPIFADANRRCAVLPFLLNNEPPNYATSSHPSSASRDDHQKPRRTRSAWNVIYQLIHSPDIPYRARKSPLAVEVSGDYFDEDGD